MGKHRLDLLNNSISYFKEAVNYAQQESPDTNQWKFAIIHVVQALELAFKEYLRRIHPVFIFESIDKADKTVSLRTALGRLRNPHIGKVTISEGEKSKLENAFDLRNELTHFEFNHEHEHIELKFAEIFAFLIFFYRSHLGLAPSEFINDDQHLQIFQLVKARAELLDRARQYIQTGNVGEVWVCPSCNEDTFLVAFEQCCFCHHREVILACESCGEDTLESQIVDVSDLWEWQWDEGRAHLVNDYGITETACVHCVGDVKDRVEDLRRAQYLEDMEMDARSFR